MSNFIEERILSMRFDNSNFEKNAKQSMDTLDKLDRSLQLTEGSSGLSTVGSLLEVVSDKFSILGTVGDQVVRRITDSIMNLAGQVPRLIKSLSVDQINAGWSKYADKTSAVQTIMAATAKDWDNTEAQMEFVNGQLEKLNWFTDETSYSFLDMVNNIGKFTSNNVKLEDAVTAMEGISTWAAISGANVSEAGRAMYNLSQAMAVGSVKLMDWKSIENANMATREFKETVLATAVAEGTLTQQADGMYKTMQGHLFTAEQFNTQLSDGWFSSKVLMKTLDQYGAFSNKLQEVSDDTNRTATELLMIIKKYKETGEVVPELRSQIEMLSSSEYELGLRAFQAAQEAKTFAEAISATQDAVSTGWMNTFELIFGNYQEAKGLWTDLANGMYEIFAEGGNKRNDLLREWRNYQTSFTKTSTLVLDNAGHTVKEVETVILDGREILLEGFYNLGSTIITMIDTIKEAFHDIFPPMTAKRLIDLTIKFQHFTKSLKPSEETLEKIKSILKGLFSIFDIGIMAVKALYNVLKEKLFPIFKDLGGNLFDSAASFGDWLTNLRDSIKENDTFAKSLQNISSFFEPIIDWINKTSDAIKNFIKENAKIETIANVWNSVKNAVSAAYKFVVDKIGKIKDALSGVFTGNNLGSDIFKILGGLGAVFLGFKGIDALKNNPLANFIDTLKDGLSGILDNFNDILSNVGSAINSFTNQTNSKALLNIAISIGILAASLVVLASIDSNKLGAALLAVTGSLGELIGSLKLLGMIGGSSMKKASTGLIAIAAAVLLLSFAVKIFSGIDLADLAKGLGAMAVSLLVLVAALALISKFVNPKSTANMLAAGAAMIGMAVAMIIVAGAVAIFGIIPYDVLVQGLTAFAITLGVVSLALGLLGKFANGGKMLAAGAAMIALAAAMVVFAAAIAIFSFIPYDNLVQGMVAFVAVLLFSVTALAVLSAMSAQVIIAAAAMLLLGLAIDALAAAVLVFALIPTDGLIQGILGLTAVLIVVIAALVVLGAIGPVVMVGAAAMLVLSAALLITAAAMIVMAGGLAALSAIGATEILKIAGALAVLGPALVLLAVGCAAMTLGLVGAAALAVLGLSLNTLVGIDIYYIAGGLALLGPALVLLAVGGVALGVASVGLLAGSVAMAALGLAFIPFAAGLHRLDDVDKDTILKFLEVLAISVAALAGLGLIAEAFAAGFAILGAACLAAGAGIALAGEGIALIVDSILKIPDKATGRLKEMAKAMADALLDRGKEATNALEDVMNDLVKTVKNHESDFKSAAKNLASAFVNSFDDISKVIDTISKLMRDAIRVFESNRGSFESAGVSLMTSVSSGVYSKSNDFVNAIEQTMFAGATAVMNSTSNYSTAGSNIDIGLANGIYYGTYYPVNAMTEVNEKVYEVFKKYWGIHSPSTLMESISGYIPKGAGRGIEKNSSYVSSAMTDMGDEMVDALSPALAIISGLLDGSFDFTPTVRPVVDMDDIYKSANEVGSLFNSANIGAYMASKNVRINDASSGYFDGDPAISSSNETITNTVNIYPQPNQSIDEIANAVESKLTFMYRQKKGAGVV